MNDDFWWNYFCYLCIYLFVVHFFIVQFLRDFIRPGQNYFVITLLLKLLFCSADIKGKYFYCVIFYSKVIY